ncbi:DUF1634 domain-containing protein [Moorella sp. Hama-1]|uniref:DUF1634 domain-containing protein n=1 Tax=Moorella sp. Hama-1 TaxID=2138101 RepID=UPI000D65C8F0|nr:DUF1634 domain-containing protein [Moorella sp. Hama-1]MDN5362725.1 hypothetical protein [Moorella sp. (in: firmicutes)]BCV22282.1 hypothetical protein hamaS1_23510 [Moorella sp. Hama-1]
MEANLQKKPAGEPRAVVVEDFISRSLRWGVVISSLVIAAGVILYVITGSSGYPADIFPSSIPQVMDGLAHFKPFAVIDLGLLLLIATPIFRVAASIIAFIVDRDRPYILITSYVLAMLILSLLLGKAE